MSGLKAIILPLSLGTATFYVGGNNFVISHTKDKDTCCFNDGIHNNGGWVIHQSYDKTIKEINIVLGL